MSNLQLFLGTSTPPVIPTDVNNRTNTTKRMNVVNVIGTTIGDEQVTMSGGYVSGLDEPVSQSDIATKQYVDTFVGKSPVGPNTSIQINDGADGFIGTTQLTFDGSTMIIDAGANGIVTNGYITISDSKITDLEDPTDSTQAATENYTFNSINLIGTIVQSDIGWLARSAAQANSWRSVVWSHELGLFCAVSSTGANLVMTSLNGTTWTPRVAATADPWLSVCWSPDLTLFCAVTANSVMTSSDGINWDSRTAAESNIWTSVCWSPELTLFCAVSLAGAHRVMTSPDGIVWTSQTHAEDNPWYSVAWSPELGLFCAVAGSGTNSVMTSSDGILWVARQAANQYIWTSVCWSPDVALFCAVSSDGVMTSPDGIAWTSRVSAVDNTAWSSVCWSHELGLFCAVAETGASSRVMTSPDGITWTGASAAEQNNWTSVCWCPDNGGLFCAVSSSGANRVMIRTASCEPLQIETSMNADYSYTPVQVVNRIIDRTFTDANVGQSLYGDYLPSPADVINLIPDTQLGSSYTTIIRYSGEDQYIYKSLSAVGTDLDGYPLYPLSKYFNLVLTPTLSLFNLSPFVIKIVSVVTNTTAGSESISGYVTNFYNDISERGRIVDSGLYTPTIQCPIICMPLAPTPNFDSSSPITYTYDDFKRQLIIRKGLNANVTDVFPDAIDVSGSSDFLTGNGTFRFFIQNVSAHDLTLTPGANWTSGTGVPLTIPSLHCAAYMVVVTDAPTCTLYCLCISSLVI